MRSQGQGICLSCYLYSLTPSPFPKHTHTTPNSVGAVALRFLAAVMLGAYIYIDNKKS